MLSEGWTLITWKKGMWVRSKTRNEEKDIDEIIECDRKEVRED